MDEVVYYLYSYGLYFVFALAIIKVLVIILYRGFDLPYLFENFLLIYTDPGVGATPEKLKFRKIHNVFTILFYTVALAWVAIFVIVKLVR